MKSAIAIRHVGFEDLGAFAAPLRAAGYTLAYRDVGADDLDAPDIAAADLLVVLGGPIGVYEDALYPFLRQEIALLEKRLAANQPTLGICLGAQLIARAAREGQQIRRTPDEKDVWHWRSCELEFRGRTGVGDDYRRPYQGFRL
jgi:GMP synthase (glutamine-hydrolysing)